MPSPALLDGNSIGTWVISGAALIGFATSVIGMFITRREAEQRATQIDNRIELTAAESEKRATQIEDRLGRLEDTVNANQTASTESRRQLYNHIDEVRKELGEKIDIMPDRVLALLKTTGVIK